MRLKPCSLQIVHLQAVSAEGWVFEEFPEALHIPLPAHIGQVRHHVGNDLEPCILGQVEAVSYLQTSHIGFGLMYKCCVGFRQMALLTKAPIALLHARCCPLELLVSA